MSFLIDGYNLMHAVGLVVRNAPPGEFDRARGRMLRWLNEAHPPDDDVRVVFDAREARNDVEEAFDRLRVTYAGGREADDYIEEAITAEANPARLTVVSNDRRIRDAARRRGCVSWDCGRYLDWLADRERPARPPPTTEPGKPGDPSDEEVRRWLEEFGDPA